MAIRLCEPPGLTAFYTGCPNENGDDGARDAKENFAEKCARIERMV